MFRILDKPETKIQVQNPYHWHSVRPDRSFRKNGVAFQTLWVIMRFAAHTGPPGDISESLYLNTHASIWQEAARPAPPEPAPRREPEPTAAWAEPRTADTECWLWLRQLRPWPDIINWLEKTIAATTMSSVVTSSDKWGAGAMPNTGDGGGKGKLDAAKRLGMSKHQGNINYEHVHSNSPNSLFLWGIKQCHVKIGMFKNDCEWGKSLFLARQLSALACLALVSSCDNDT